MNYKILAFLLIHTSIFGAAGEATQAPNSYNGVPITAESLHDLMPYMLDADRIPFDAWIATPSAQSILKQLLAFDNLQAWRTKMEEDNKRLQELNMPNTSKWNYVFNIPGQNFVVKIAGPANRLQSTLMAHGFWPGEKPTKPISKVDTYQTASRAAYYLILKKFIEENKFTRIATPDTYLVRFPSSAKSIDDEYAIIVQKALPKSISDKKLTPELATTLENETISEIVHAVIGMGLWSIHGNLLLDTETNKAHPIVQLVDLEQPNNSAPADFFHKDATRYYGNLRFGLEELFDLFAGSPEKRAYIRTLIEAHPVFNSPHFNPRYKRELIGVLQAKAPRSE